MRTLFIGMLLLAYVFPVQAQDEYIIEGNIKGLKNGTVFTLFRRDGRVGSSIARDTVRNETFRFKERVAGERYDRLSLSCHSEDFPSMSLAIYATPGAKISISGSDNLLYTWKVDSPVKEQKDFNRFIDATRDLWNDYQKTLISQNACRMMMRADAATDAEKATASVEREALDKLIEELQVKIAEREIAILKTVPISDVELDNLYGQSFGVRYNEKFPYTQDVIALYNGLTDKQKASPEGLNIAANLFPPAVVKEGDLMADADLYDLEGKLYRLADFKGRYILLDFWSSGCGPCIMALPEMKEIQEQYADRLVLVSLSSDTEKRWKASAREHDMTWQNLSDLKQTAGLYAKYGVNSIPNYVLISPEGKVMKMWSGYGPGSLKLKMRRWLDTTKREMSIIRQGEWKTVNYPNLQSSNTDNLEIKQVLLTDTATVVRFNAYYIPKYWIQLSPNSHLVDSKGNEYALKKAEGITPGEHFFLPESGEAEFVLYFAPMPVDTDVFDFTEGDTKDSWQLKGVGLE